MGKRVIYSMTPNRTTQALSNVELAAAGTSCRPNENSSWAGPAKLIFYPLISCQVSCRLYLRPWPRVLLSESRSCSRFRDKEPGRVPAIRDLWTSSGSCTRRED